MAASKLPSIELYNTLTKKKEPLVTVQPGKVGMYLCGPTVYKPSHIGHMVGPVIFDTIKRYLEYSGWTVTWVVNITDVDDKIIEASHKSKMSIEEITNKVTNIFHKNLVQNTHFQYYNVHYMPLHISLYIYCSNVT